MVPLVTGVPQGSVLGPILFTLYVAPLSDITEKHSINSHFYADDSQLYVFVDRKSGVDRSILRLETCIQDIRFFMRNNFLKLNDDKSEVY